MTLICLNGPPGVGKTTIANFLHRDCQVRRLDLTRPFKRFIEQALGITEEQAVEYKDKPINVGVTLRDLQIEVATCLEKADPAVWIKRAMDQYDPRRVWVLDSVGKVAQWRWLVDNIDDLFLWRVRDGDDSKINTENGTFIDGREAIEREDCQEGSIFIEITNYLPMRRNEFTWQSLREEVIRLESGMFPRKEAKQRE